MILKTLHRKLNIEQHEPVFKTGVTTGAPERQAVPVPLVAPIVILVINRERRNDRIVIMTNSTYSWHGYSVNQDTVGTVKQSK